MQFFYNANTLLLAFLHYFRISGASCFLYNISGGLGWSEQILNTMRFLDFEILCADPLLCMSVWLIDLVAIKMTVYR